MPFKVTDASTNADNQCE